MNRLGKAILWIMLALVAAAQAFGLYLLIRTAPATKLELSETALVLHMDEGRRITHEIEPAAAGGKLLRYKVSASDEVIAWIDEQNEMIIAVSPGVCTIAAELDGLRATVDVTVTEGSVLSGAWANAAGDVHMTLDPALRGTLETPDGAASLSLFRGAFSDGEIKNPYRWVKLTGDFLGAPIVLLYDRLNDEIRFGDDTLLRKS